MVCQTEPWYVSIIGGYMFKVESDRKGTSFLIDLGQSTYACTISLTSDDGY